MRSRCARTRTNSIFITTSRIVAKEGLEQRREKSNEDEVAYPPAVVGNFGGGLDLRNHCAVRAQGGAAGKLTIGLWDHIVPTANKTSDDLVQEWAAKEKTGAPVTRSIFFSPGGGVTKLEFLILTQKRGADPSA